MKYLLLSVWVALFAINYGPVLPGKSSIDRLALVSRNNPRLTSMDTLGSLTVGNGRFAFTVDATGLQSFPDYYDNGISLGTQSEWGWHSFSNTGNYVLKDVLVDYETCNDHSYPIAIQHKEGRAKAAADWLRMNTQRLHLGLIGLEFKDANGLVLNQSAIRNIDQELNLWTGAIHSKYTIDNQPVEVILYAHPEEDAIAFKITSPLIEAGRLSVTYRFPNAKRCHVCPGYDWDTEEEHQTKIIQQDQHNFRVERTLDSTRFFVAASWQEDAVIEQTGTHAFALRPHPRAKSLTGSVRFEPKVDASSLPNYQRTLKKSTKVWEAFWQDGGAIDFSACTDARAPELERRVVLSQYLTRVQCTGQYPPQETGLTMNSWYGKFHLEMHWWHGVHFALWNRLPLLEESLPWYQDALPNARATAKRQGFAGVRWQKMTSPEALSSPSSVGEFLVWQQPHPIYFAELIYRQKPTQETLEKYQEIIFETADFMADFAQLSKTDGKYHLCAPIIPAQEIFHATETNDPPFEVAYWHYALGVAQQWRLRLGLEPNLEWQEVLDGLAPLPQHDGLYLPCAGATEAYTDDENRRDHPIVTGVLGMLPAGPHVDPAIMGATFDEIMDNWQWETTWGWDYPMLAMSAARLEKQDQAIEALFLAANKNTYLVNGHNYQDERLRLYLPGNGGLLTAVAMMAAGWDGAPDIAHPGFPQDGTWNIRWENLQRMP